MEKIIPNTNDSSTPSGIEEQNSAQQDFDFDIFDVKEVENSNQGNQAQSEEEGFEIDERFKNLDPNEARFRTIQSRYDKLQNEYQEIIKQREQEEVYLSILNDLMEDDIVLEAFLRERKPELVQNRNSIVETIQKKMREEFGDVKYSRADIDDNYEAWLYFKRLDELYEQYKGSNPKVQTLKEAIQLKREAKKKAEEESRRLLISEMNQVKKDLNWDDKTLEQFYNWTQKLKIQNLAKIFNFQLKTKSPNISTVQGNPLSQSLRSKFLDTF